jgi:hypothetical protein
LVFPLIITRQSATYKTITSIIRKEMQKYTDDKTGIPEEQKEYCRVSK